MVRYGAALAGGVFGSAFLIWANGLGAAGTGGVLAVFPPGVDGLERAIAADAPIRGAGRFANLVHTATLNDDDRERLRHAGAIVFVDTDLVGGCAFDPAKRAAAF